MPSCPEASLEHQWLKSPDSLNYRPPATAELSKAEYMGIQTQGSVPAAQPQ